MDGALGSDSHASLQLPAESKWDLRHPAASSKGKCVCSSPGTPGHLQPLQHLPPTPNSPPPTHTHTHMSWLLPWVGGTPGPSSRLTSSFFLFQISRWEGGCRKGRLHRSSAPSLDLCLVLWSSHVVSGLEPRASLLVKQGFCWWSAFGHSLCREAMAVWTITRQRDNSATSALEPVSAASRASTRPQRGALLPAPLAQWGGLEVHPDHRGGERTRAPTLRSGILWARWHGVVTRTGKFGTDAGRGGSWGLCINPVRL